MMNTRNLLTTLQKNHSYHFDIGEVFIFDNYAISEINEGIHLTFKESRELLKVVLSHFGNRQSFGYISNRIHSYSVAPIELIKIQSLIKAQVKVGLVTYSKTAKLAATYESVFWPKQCTIHQFDMLENAIKWMEN